MSLKEKWKPGGELFQEVQQRMKDILEVLIHVKIWLKWFSGPVNNPAVFVTDEKDLLGELEHFVSFTCPFVFWRRLYL